MSWREELQAASFRGVEFHVSGGSASFGRRLAVHEYPYRDTPYVEDLGRRARNMRVEALVIGDDYMQRRNALIEAVETAGSGKLVHPYYGELTVSVDDSGLEIEESTANGGMARLVFSVIESGEAKFPTATQATGDVAAERAQDAKADVAQGFADTFDVSELPAFAFDDALGMVDGALAQIEGIVDVLPGIGAGRGDILGLIGLVRPDLANLLQRPLELAGHVQDLFATVRGALDPALTVRAFEGLSRFGSDATPITVATAVRARQSANRKAVVEMVRAAAAIERAVAATAVEFPDYTTAARTRDSVAEQLDLVADTTTSDGLFQTLTALRSAVVRDIGLRGASLARVTTVTPAATVPALVLAYQLYEDPLRDDGIVARNAVRHPGFLPAGRPLEVLTDG